MEVEYPEFRKILNEIASETKDLEEKAILPDIEVKVLEDSLYVVTEDTVAILIVKDKRTIKSALQEGIPVVLDTLLKPIRVKETGKYSLKLPIGKKSEEKPRISYLTLIDDKREIKKVVYRDQPSQTK